MSYPKTWLLTDGWRTWGAVGLDERPGPKIVIVRAVRDGRARLSPPGRD